MSYANEADIYEELNSFGSEGSDNLTDALVTRGMNRADRLINNKLKSNGIPTNLEDEDLKEIGTLLSVSRCLDILYEGQDNRSSTAIQNDKDADALLEGFIEEYLKEDHDDPTPLQETPTFSSLI